MESENFCPHCNKESDIRSDKTQGKLVCMNCGLVIEDHCIDPTAEYRIFADGSSSGGDPRRTGGTRNELLADGGLSLSISGNRNSESTQRMIMMSSRLGGAAENRTLYKGQQFIQQWGGLLNIQKRIIQTAEDLFSKIENTKKSLKGRSIESVAAATLYIASRVCALPLKPHDIENVSHVNIKDIKGAYKAIKDVAEHIPPLDPPRYCQQFCKKLGMTNEASNAAYKICQNIKDQRLLDGKNPRTIASAAIYITIQLSQGCNVSLKDISLHSKIAENTIKNSYKEVFPKKNEIIPEWKGRLPLDTLHG